MAKSIVTLFLCLIAGFGHAHEADEAFFNIAQKESTIEIMAEFSWAIRNALIAFDPQLKDATDKDQFKNAFERYIKSTLILTDQNGKELNLLEFREIENMGHSHQNNYLIVFSGNNLQTISNTMMFNKYDGQTNFHTIWIDLEVKIFKTTLAQPSFELTNSQSDAINFRLVMGIVLMVLTVLFFIIRRVAKQN